MYWYDDILKRKRFVHDKSFARGIHRWPKDSPHKGPVMRDFYVSIDVRLSSQQTIELLMIGDAMTLMWRHSNWHCAMRLFTIPICAYTESQKSRCFELLDTGLEVLWNETVCQVSRWYEDFSKTYYVFKIFRDLGAVSIRKTVLPGMAIPMLKIRRPNGRLIFNMEIAIRR